MITTANAAPAPHRPLCRLPDTDGNVRSIIGRVRRVLAVAGGQGRAREFVEPAWSAGSYKAILAFCHE